MEILLHLPVYLRLVLMYAFVHWDLFPRSSVEESINTVAYALTGSSSMACLCTSYAVLPE